MKNTVFDYTGVPAKSVCEETVRFHNSIIISIRAKRRDGGLHRKRQKTNIIHLNVARAPVIYNNFCIFTGTMIYEFYELFLRYFIEYN